MIAEGSVIIIKPLNLAVLTQGDIDSILPNTKFCCFDTLSWVCGFY